MSRLIRRVGPLNVLVALLVTTGARPRATSRHAEEADIQLVHVEAAVNLDKRFELFALGANGHVYHRWEQTSGPQWSDWAENESGAFTDVKVVRSHGKLCLFGLDGGVLAIRMQAAAGSSFSDASLRTGIQLKHISVAVDAAERIYVVAVGGNGALWTMHSVSADPTLRQQDWSGWSVIGGSGLDNVVLARDGSGYMTVAATGASNQLYLAQQGFANPTAPWGDFPVGAPRAVAHLQFVLGSDHALWLFGIGDRGWLYGRSLAQHGTMTNALTVTPPARGARGTTVVAHPPAVATVGSRPPPTPPLAWTEWAVISQQAFVLLTDISAISGSGSVTLTGVSSSTSVVQLTQRADGTWPNTYAVLPSDKRINDFLTVSSAINQSATARIFIIERVGGKVYTIAHDVSTTWNGQQWTVLGKIAGANEPDLVFAAGLCLEAVVGGAGSQADALRATIAAAIPASIAKAVAGTPLAGVIGNVNASSRCTPKGELLEVWLQHEVWPPAFQEWPTIPGGAAFVYNIPAATLTRIIEPQLVDAMKKVKDIEIVGHQLKLVAPNSIEIDINAKWSGLGFDAKIVASLGVTNETPSCVSTVTATRPQGLYAILLSLAFPISAGSSVVQLGDELESEQLAKLSSQAAVICRLTDAVLSSFILPPSSATSPLQMLVIPYSALTVDPALGIVGSGGIPTLRAPKPTISMYYVPVGPQLAGRSSYDVWFFATTTEMDGGGLSLQWTPSKPSETLQLRDYLGLQGDKSNMAFFAYAVDPDKAVRSYDLDTMTVVATNAYGQRVSVSRAVSLVTRKP